MAEHAVHITTTLQPKPSIFEVVAADSLHSTFEPAVKRLCMFLINAYPERFHWIHKYFDEFYLCLNGFVQQYYLRTYGGTLAEVFYGLTRIKSNVDHLEKPSNRYLFLCTILLPYVATKLNARMKQWDSDVLDTPSLQSNGTKQKFIKFYKILSTTYGFVQIYQYLKYMSNQSASHSVLMKLFRMNLTYLPSDVNVKEWQWKDLLKGNIAYSTILSAFVFRSLELSAFFLQFIQWWQNDANNGTGNISNLPTPPPSTDIVDNEYPDRYKSKCPICLQEWIVPTVLPISGYVYCYKCIVTHLDRNQYCPITNYPARIDDLLRVYDS